MCRTQTSMEASEAYRINSAESDAKTDTSSSLNSASITDSVTVINSKTDSTLVKEQKSDEELLEGLLTEFYCHVCSSNLLYESNRLAHYKGIQHTQNVETYLNAVRAELARGCQSASNDKKRFCELCSMVFSSRVVAKSHYEGKIHAKNLRKQSLLTAVKDPPVHNSPAISQGPFNSDQNLTQEDDLALPPDPTPASDIPDPSAYSKARVDLKDPKKYCSLCAASFNNPQMALQHYNGLKHQKNKARQELITELRKDVQQGDSFVCHICGVSFTNVEMYQDHMLGNKHQIRNKKVRDLFKSQPKVYSTFTDELADYIQVQKARGITAKTNQLLPEESCQNENKGGEKAAQQEDVNQCDFATTPACILNFPQVPPPPLHPVPGTWFPLCPVQSLPPFGWPYSFPPPLFPSTTQFTGWPPDGGRKRTLSTSSISASSYSCSSVTSDTEEREQKDVEKRKTKRRRKRRKMERRYDPQERRREQFVESEEERWKSLQAHRRWASKERTGQQENFEGGQGEGTSYRSRSQSKNYVERSESGHSKSATKTRREKKRTKGRIDTRTEEEKLWDDSILGC